MTQPTPIVVVSGPPASGKTSVAAELADRLALPLIAKDGLKEVLYDELGIGDVAWSQQLGRAAMALLYESLEAQLRARRSVVVEANFAVAQARPEMLQLCERHPFAAFEVHCTAATDVLVARYAARAETRHEGHRDGERVAEITQAIVEGRNGPLELGSDIVVLDTSAPARVDLAPVAEAVRAHLVRHGRDRVLPAS